MHTLTRPMSETYCWQSRIASGSQAARCCGVHCCAMAGQDANVSAGSRGFADRTISVGSGFGGGVGLPTPREEAGRLLCVLLIRFGVVSADPTPRPRIQRYTKTGVFVCVRTLFVTLPSTTADSPPRPCDPMTMRSQPCPRPLQ